MIVYSSPISSLDYQNHHDLPSLFLMFVCAVLPKKELWTGASSEGRSGYGDLRYSKKNKSLTFTNWQEGEPVTDINFRCVALTNERQWFVGICGEKRHFVCQCAQPIRGPTASLSWATNQGVHSAPFVSSQSESPHCTVLLWTNVVQGHNKINSFLLIRNKRRKFVKDLCIFFYRSMYKVKLWVFFGKYFKQNVCLFCYVCFRNESCNLNTGLLINPVWRLVELNSRYFKSAP